jgi:hypothetical protein
MAYLNNKNYNNFEIWFCQLVVYFLLMSLFVVRANATFRTIYIQLPSTTSFDYFSPSPGRFKKESIHGKEY